jgi:branched-chain amino acid transport system permease protein
VLASSLRLINLTGQISLAHGAMMTIGGYASALLVLHLGVPPTAAMFLGAFIAAFVAALTGFAFGRLKGMYFAMVTIFFAQVVILTVQQLRSVTGGNTGLFNIARPVALDSSAKFYYVIVGMTIVSLVILYLIEKSQLGLVFRGIRQSESLSASVGMNTGAWKVLAFSLGSFFAGLVGAFYGQFLQTLTPNIFGFIFSIYVVIYMVVGGSRSFVGPLVGAVFLTVVNQLLRPFALFQPLFFAAILMLIVFLMPEGLVALPARLRAVARRLGRGGSHAS